jgi:hypothetical protein
MIENVQRNSVLANYGLRSGDIIVSVDGRPATYNALNRTITQVDHRDNVRMTVVRGGQERTLNLRGQEIVMGQRDTRVFGAPETMRFDHRRRIDDRRYDEQWGVPRGRDWEEPSRQEQLFRLPGQVPPGPDRGVYRPTLDERYERDIRQDWDRRDTWDRDVRRDPWARDVRRDTWDTWDRDTRGTWDRQAPRRNGWDR